MILLLLTLFTYISASPLGGYAAKGRIIGGHDINITDAPYQVSLLVLGHHSCGGSIIGPSYIVTAAHCTSDLDASMLSIRAGSSVRDTGGQVIAVKEINHPKYDTNTINNDIAVLELESSLSLNEEVAVIQLPSENTTWPPGTDALVSGWGITSENGIELATNLQGVVVQIVDETTCKKAYYGEGVITPSMLCAGVDGGGKDSCSSDSGGPLAVGGVLGGVVSWGTGCGRPDYPGVYANVPALRSFINDVTGI